MSCLACFAVKHKTKHKRIGQHVGTNTHRDTEDEDTLQVARWSLTAHGEDTLQG